ncbi:hypothetical protein ASZ90_002615 [hydrocarbon metagenome]|uniref:Histidine kinase n=1 Tax=hydrocarbon metagenome TaxID=938273 RepID=A0A0W8G3B4_9ZZZZ
MTGPCGPAGGVDASLARVFDVVPDGLCILSADLTVLRMNRAMAGWFAEGGDPEGRSCREVLAAKGCSCRECPAEAAMAGHACSMKEMTVPLPGGGARYLELSTMRLPGVDGGRDGVLLFARDVSVRKAAERELRQANRDIEQLLSSIGSIMISLDGNGAVTRWNRAAAEMLGLSGHQALGRALFDLDVGWDWAPVREAIEACRRTGEAVRVDEIRRRMAGKERFFGLTANPVPSPEGQSPGVLILGRDITGIKVREAMASHEIKMQSIGRLAAGIAHEINTPIQYVSYNAGFLEGAFADLLRLVEAYRQAFATLGRIGDGGGDRLPPELRRIVEDAEAEADLEYLAVEIPAAVANSRKGIRQVADIVRAMRQFSHPGGREKTFFDINAALKDALLVSRNEWKDTAGLVTELDPDLPPVCGLPQEIGQVFLNLILNAAQAMEETRGDKTGILGTLTARTARQGDTVAVSVADTGPGIPDAVRGRVFDPFFTTKEVGKGTGQGLSLAYAVVERHGGEIFFETTPGEGAVFTVRLPIDCPGEQDGSNTE